MAVYHTVDGQPYSVTAGTDVTVTDADGLILGVSAGGQGSFVGNGGDVTITGEHHFVQIKGGGGGGNGGGGEPFDGNLPDNDLRVGELGGDKKIYLNGLEIMQESTVIVDVVEANNANAVTSNAVFNALQDVPSSLVPGDGISIGDDNVISVDTSGGEVVSGNTLPVSGDTVNSAMDVHKEDTSLHKSVEEQEQLSYLIANYGMRHALPLPVPHPVPYDPEEPQDEGEWTYQSDAALQAAGYFLDRDILKYDMPAQHPDGRWPVYGVLIPWFNQLDGTTEHSSEFYDRATAKTWDDNGAEPSATYANKLPDIAILGQDSAGHDIKSPWLFDSLVYDSALGRKRARRWKPAEGAYTNDGSADGPVGTEVIAEAGVDEWMDGVSTDPNDHGEQLWKWWDVNYVRCDNGNRRIAAMRNEDHSGFQPFGDVDVGVAFNRRYMYCGRVQCYNSAASKWVDYMLLLISGGPIDDAKFPAPYKAVLDNESLIRGMGPSGDIRQAIEPVLWKECQRYAYNESASAYDISPGIYGIHSKYQSVLGGSAASGRLPRSQRGHILNAQSYSTLAYDASSSINDNVRRYDATGTQYTVSGYPNYIRKGPGYKGGGMDRMAFIGLHMMMKTGSKDSQLYMRGLVQGLEYSTTTACTTVEAREAVPEIVPADDDEYYCSVVIPHTASSEIKEGRFIAIGDNNANPRNTFSSGVTRAVGRVLSRIPAGMIGSTDCDALRVHLWEDYGLKSLEHAKGEYVVVVLPPSGCTDCLGNKDGSDVSCTVGTTSPCRFFGTEFALGAWNVNMDTHVDYDSDKKMHLYYAGPQRTRQRTRATIRDYHEDLTPNGFGHDSSSYWQGDLVFDMRRGVYTQTKQGTSTGNQQRGTRDYVYRESVANEIRIYAAYGGAGIMTGDIAGVWGACVYHSGAAGLTTALWYACSCD